MDIHTYVVEDSRGEYVSEEYETLQEAIDDAVDRNSWDTTQHAVICLTHIFDDSELAWAPDGAATWPPAQGD